MENEFCSNITHYLRVFMYYGPLICVLLFSQPAVIAEVSGTLYLFHSSGSALLKINWDLHCAESSTQLVGRYLKLLLSGMM